MYRLMMIMDKVSTPQTLIVLSIVSEVLGMFRVHPVCYAAKVCVDMPKEMIKIMVISK